MVTKITKPLMIALCLATFSAANAHDHIDMSHHVVASIDNGMYQSISLTLTIRNNGIDDLHNVKISPSGNEFAMSERDSVFNIGYLPSMGQSVIQITADTPMAESYFHSMMPVFFLLSAKMPGGEIVELPLYSQGGGL